MSDDWTEFGRRFVDRMVRSQSIMPANLSEELTAELLEHHRGRIVAIHDGRLIASDWYTPTVVDKAAEQGIEDPMVFIVPGD